MKLITFLILSILIVFAKESEKDLVLVDVVKEYEVYPIEGKNHIAFQFNMKPKWHIYWRNPGDSGLQTQIELESDGLKFGEILWPTPEKIPFDGMANFGYKNSVTLFVPFELESIKSEYKIKSNISWLVCKESCIPQDTSFEFSIKSGKNPKKE